MADSRAACASYGKFVSIPQLRVCEASVLQNRQRASRGFENFSVQPGNQHSGLSARLALSVTRLRDDPDPWRRVEFAVYLTL